MSPITGDQSAYPHAVSYAHGLTKRELFAAMAMQGMLSNPQTVEALALGVPDPNDVAALMGAAAVDHANELIAALSKEQP